MALYRRSDAGEVDAFDRTEEIPGGGRAPPSGGRLLRGYVEHERVRIDGVTRFVDLIDGVPATSGNGVLTLDLPAYGVRWLRTEE